METISPYIIAGASVAIASISIIIVTID